MTRNTKIIAGILAALLLVCACGAAATIGALGAFGMAFSRAVQPETGQVQDSAARIADFSLPSGYKAEAVLNLAGYTFLSYAPGDGHSHITFVQAPASLNVTPADLEQYYEQGTADRAYNRRARSQIVGQKQATIRGQTVTLAVGEGTNSDGQSYRTMTGVFQGKGGPTLLSIEEPVSRWNQATVDAFIASIR